MASTYVSCTTAICLFVLQTSFTISRSHIDDTSDGIAVMCMSECIKLGLAYGMASRDSKPLVLFETPTVLLFPSIAFTILNVVSFWVLKHSNASIYVILIQMKAPCTMLLSFLTMRKMFTPPQVIAVLLICICCGNVVDTTKSSRVTETLAVCGMVVEVVIASATTVYMQKIFNNSPRTLWIRNMEMSLISIVLYGVGAVYLRRFTYTLTGVFFSALAATSGILSALCVLYCGATPKAVTSSVTVLSVTFIDALLSNQFPSMQRCSFYVISSLAILLYTYQAPPYSACDNCRTWKTCPNQTVSDHGHTVDLNGDTFSFQGIAAKEEQRIKAFDIKNV